MKSSFPEAILKCNLLLKEEINMYNPKSTKAEEFICHEEVLESLKFADEKKDDIEYVKSIIEKAKLRKGLSHREASVLLACDNEEINNEIFQTTV